MTQKTQAKILQFERNAEYYYKRFEKLADNFQYFDALVNIRCALQKDPDNQEYQLSMAEILTEMGIYEESNTILFPLFYHDCLYPADVLFNMGCNFFGMQDNEKAQQCLSQYLSQYPDDDFVYDAADMLDVIEAEQEDPLDALTAEENALADHGKYLIGICDFEGAAAVLEKLTAQRSDLVFAENNLSLAYYCSGDIDRAITAAGRVLKKEPQNLHALCNLALFYHAKGIANTENLYLSRLSSLSPADSDESLKLLLTYCELQEHKKVCSMMTTVLQEKPYDARVLYLAAIASANTGNYKDASVHLENMLKLDPLDSVAAYYKTVIDGAMEGRAVGMLDYNYQVPTDEIRDRLEYLNGCLHLSDEVLREKWQREDLYLKRTVLWGVYTADRNIKRICLELLNVIGDHDALRMLRNYLLKENEPDEMKNDVFLMLSLHGVPLPYIAYINGKIAEVNMRSTDEQSIRIRKCHMELMEALERLPQVRDDMVLLKQCADILEHYLHSKEKSPVMRNTDSWAVAILFTAYSMFRDSLHVDLAELCSELSVPYDSVLRCVRKLRDSYREEI